MIRTSNLPADLTSWRQEVMACATKYRSAAWELIDMLHTGMERFGEAAFWQVAEDTGLSKHTLENYLSLGKAFPISRRRENIAIGIHETVRTLDPDRQDTVFDCCEKFDWGRAEVRDRMRAYKAGDDTAWDPRWKPQLETIVIEPPHEPPDRLTAQGDAEQPGEVNRPRHLHRATPFEVLCEAWNEAPAHIKRAFVQEHHPEIASLLAGIGGGEGSEGLGAPEPGEAPHDPGTLPDDEDFPDLPPFLDRGAYG